jgi:hypothetical protein
MTTLHTNPHARSPWSFRAALPMLALVGGQLATEGEAHAQAAPAAAGEVVSPTAKGAIGGGLLGAELVMITESLIGVKPWWAYLVGGGLGAVGGAVGGYFVEKSVSDGRIPLFMLAGGLALIIPTTILTLNATRYRPSENATEDKAPTNEPKADPGGPGTNAAGQPQETAPAPSPAPAPAAAPPATPPTTLLEFAPNRLRIGVPIPEVRPVFSIEQRKMYGVGSGGSEVRVPMVKLIF